jgi:hypothetical protein
MDDGLDCFFEHDIFFSAVGFWLEKLELVFLLMGDGVRSWCGVGKSGSGDTVKMSSATPHSSRNAKTERSPSKRSSSIGDAGAMVLQFVVTGFSQ